MLSNTDKKLIRFTEFGAAGYPDDVASVQQGMELARYVFREAMRDQGRDNKLITAVLTKFTDAGRRSPPTAAFSKLVPGRPQRGSDGNRERRWRLDQGHKFYADEIPATLVEIRYILQALSMENAPPFPAGTIQHSFDWLLGHRVEPGEYLDPIQLIPLDLNDFFANRRSIQSGHIYPLDRGGKHEPRNTFLMLARSNQLQGNNTVPELIDIMRSIVQKHDERPGEFDGIGAPEG